MAQENLNGIEPIEVEDNTKILIGLRKKSDSTLLAVSKEQFVGYDMRSYSIDGIIVRNEDEEVDLLFTSRESNATFGIGPEDIPETDKRRKKAPVNPSFYELDGYARTQWQLNNHPDTHEQGCAICEAVKFGWLPSNGEMTWAVERKDKFNEAADICNADLLNAGKYWCSTQYDPDYMWCYNAESAAFEFWHSKSTSMAIRPVKSAADYKEVIG